MNIEEPFERIKREIRNRAVLLIADNPARIGDLNFVETAMLIGASVVLEQPLDDKETNNDAFMEESEDMFRQLFGGYLEDNQEENA